MLFRFNWQCLRFSLLKKQFVRWSLRDNSSTASLGSWHDLHTDWHWTFQPFEACVTNISICSHSGWHYRWFTTL